MPGTSPGMTRRVGRSDGSHPQGRRRPQPALRLHRPFLIPQAPGPKLIISRRCRALAHARMATRHASRGAVAPYGPLRSPVPVRGERLVGCRARRLLSRSPGRRPGARDCAPRRMSRKASERSERPAIEDMNMKRSRTAARSGARRGCAGSRGPGRWSRALRSPPPAPG